MTDTQRGILAMCLAMASFIVSDVCSKLVTTALPISETIALRGVIASAIFAVPVLLGGSLPMLAQRFGGLWLLRVVTEVTGALTYVSAITFLPIANVVSISQTSPLLMTAVAAVFLRERVGVLRWCATIAGFAGVVLIVWRGLEGFSWWSLAAVGTMLSVVVRDVATRRMDRTIPVTLITLTTAVGVTAGGFLLGLFETGWRFPTGQQWLYLASAAFFVALGYAFSIEAVRRAELSAVAPFRYTILPMSLLAGWLVWREIPHRDALIGIAIIALAGVVTFARTGQPANR